MRRLAALLVILVAVPGVALGNTAYSNVFTLDLRAGATPTASFTWSPSSPKAGQQVQFTDTSSGSPTTWSWDFGDGSTSSLQNPVHSYSSAGDYSVKFTASNQFGSDSEQRTITIDAGGAGGDEITVSLPGGVPLVLVRIPAGTFMMGSPVDERGRWDDEDLHEVTLTSDYWLGKYEVTQGQWESLMGPIPSCEFDQIVPKSPDHPVICVSWDAATGEDGFIDRLNTFMGTNDFRLPTEAEWERAARAGTQTRFSHGDVLSCDDNNCDPCPEHDLYMWWCGTPPSDEWLDNHRVGSKLPNGYGVYDMHGNLLEMVQDWYEESLGVEPQIDPLGPATGTRRVLRSGNSGYASDDCRSASRLPFGSFANGGNTTGFRIARSESSAPMLYASFSWSPTSPFVGQAVQFTDTSTGTPTSWSWTFGDGATSSQRNPTHTYATAGTYTVSLTVSNQTGSDTVTRQITVTTGNSAPTASFTWSPSSPAARQQVQFTDTSTGSPTSWSWTFGDGGTSSQRNPIHTYSAAGTYTVSLTVSNQYGSDTETQQITVSPANPTPSFSYTPPNPEIGETVNFTIDGIDGEIEQAWWVFGGEGCDGSGTSYICEPGLWDDCRHATYRYATSGNKMVKLSVTINGTAYNALPKVLTVANTGSCGGGGVERNPVVFIAGAAASWLRKPVSSPLGSIALWPTVLPANVDSLSLFEIDDPDSSIFASDVIRQLPMKVYGPLLDSLVKDSGYVEYEVDDDPTRRADNCDYPAQAGSNPNLFVFAYDWRKSITEVSRDLKEYIACVKKFHPEKKVNLVAHSMGGLVARRYIIDNAGESRINALITMGTPWLGAPKLVYTLETGNFLDGYFGTKLAPNIKYAVGSFPGAHELLPSSEYFNLAGASGWPVSEREWDADGDGVYPESYSYPEFIAFVDSRYGWDSEEREHRLAGSVSQEFHAGTQDDWRSDNTGVKYYHLVGVQKSERTIGSMKAAYYQNCTRNGLQRRCVPGTIFMPKYTVGDGTVPYISAARIGNGIDLNAPGVTLEALTAADDDAVDHTGMLRTGKVISLVIQFLEDADGMPKGGAISEHENGALDSPAEPAYYVTLINVGSVVIRDGQGNSTETNPETGFPGTVPGADTLLIGEDAFSIILKPRAEYTIEFMAGDEPFGVDVKKGTSVLTVEHILYEEPGQDGILVRLVFDEAGAGEMASDQNGDGIPETTVEPVAKVYDPNGVDVDPPEMHVGKVDLGFGLFRVEVTASDESGLAGIYYSLDGRNFERYTTPVDVDSHAHPDFWVFADDTVGNRASLKITLVSPPGGTCEYVLGPSEVTVGAGGGSSSFMVLTSADCHWTVSANRSWITITSPTSMIGPGEVKFTVAANTGPNRSGTIAAGGKIFTVTQAGGSAVVDFAISNPRPDIGEVVTFSANPALGVASWNFGRESCGGNSPSINCNVWTCNVMQWAYPGAGTVDVTMMLADGRRKTKTVTVQNRGECCQATGRPDASFTASATNVNVGEVVYFTDTSAKGASSKALGFSWAPTNPEIGQKATFTLNGVTGTISKATWNFGDTGCAGASATQICVPDGLFTSCSAASFTYADAGPKQVSVELELAGGGTQSAGPSTVVVANAGSCGGGGETCSYTLSPVSSSFGASGGEGQFTVFTNTPCDWSASRTTSWIEILSASGTGSGTVRYQVKPNAGENSRSGFINVENKAHQVIQVAAEAVPDTAPTAWFWSVAKRTTGGAYAQVATHSARSFSYAFEEAGTYRVTLTAGNCVGSDTASVELQVVEAAVEDFVIGAAVSLAGLNGTHWETDLRFHNPCRELLDVRIKYEPEGENNSAANLVYREFQLQPDETRIFADISEAIPGLAGEELSGSVRIESSSDSGCKVLSISRTFNNTPYGSLGLFVPAIPVKRAEHEFLDLTGLVRNADYRTNLRLVNYGDEDTWVNLFVYDHLGSVISDTRASLVPGHSTRQINDIASWLGVDGDIAPFSVRADVTGREVQAFATVVDNLTGDSVLFLSSFTGDSRVWVVGAANNAGVNDSQWRTDVWLYNPTESWLDGAVEFVGRNDASNAYGFQWPALNRHRVREYLDIVGDELGLEETSGYLVLTGADGGPAPQVAARTYNLDPAGGTYGLNLRSFTGDDLLYPGDTGYIVGVSNSADQELGFRTNLGLLNTDRDRWTGVRLTLLDVSGVAVGEPQELLIAPGVLRQFDLAKIFGVEGITATASLKIEVTEGGGVAAYATEIDNRTNDSIFIPAQRKVLGKVN